MRWEPAEAAADPSAFRASAFVLTETEQVPHRFSIDHPVGCRGRLLHAHGRQVEELVHDLRGDRLDRLALAVVEPSEQAFGLAQLGFADLLRPRAQGCDRRYDVE